jgi:hypothetical protein
MKTKHKILAIFTYFPSLWVTEDLQKHFFFQFWILNFTFWRNFTNKKKLFHCHCMQVTSACLEAESRQSFCKARGTHLIMYIAVPFSRSMAKIIFLNIKFSWNCLFQMPKFKGITREGKIQNLVETQDPIHQHCMYHGSNNWQHFSLL